MEFSELFCHDYPEKICFTSFSESPTIYQFLLADKKCVPQEEKRKSRLHSRACPSMAKYFGNLL